MLGGSDFHDPVLINSIGHSAGLFLFGLITVLLIRDRRAHGVRRTGLSLLAALLAFAWNIGSLVALAAAKQNFVEVGVMAASFSVLSLLPAVLLHVVLEGRRRLVTTTGYVVSACAILLHILELSFPAARCHQAALLLVAIGFGVLTIISFFQFGSGVTDKGIDVPYWVPLACLFLFTSSFPHFGYQHVNSPWSAEIAWHHIGIPVALIVLLQDYRSLLLDTFLRFLVNFGLAATYIAGLLLLNEKFRLWESIRHSTFFTGIALVALSLTLILFAQARNSLQVWVTRVVFQRQSTRVPISLIGKLASIAQSETELLSRAGDVVATHLRADGFSIAAKLEERNGTAIALRFSSGDTLFLRAGPRRGGRRYFSEDLEEMRLLGSVIVEQVERFRAAELRRLATQAELRALQAQINPHFLFNALNTLYGTIDRGSFDARRMVLNLSDIFRYLLQGERSVIQLSEELRIVRAYLEIEALRLGERLEAELVVSDQVDSVMIPVLSIQPLIENAVKHGIAPHSGRGKVTLKAEKIDGGMRVQVSDTGKGFDWSDNQQKEGAGVGLENVRQRLTLCYGTEADLQIVSSGAGTIVTFFVPDVVRPERSTAEAARRA